MAYVNEKLMNLGILWIRILMGLGIATHGFSKIFGGKMDGFIDQIAYMGFQWPEFFGWAAMLSEFVGGILIAFGLLTRLSGFFVFATMVVAVYSFWPVTDVLGYLELALAYAIMAGALMITGGGQFSVDYLIWHKDHTKVY